MRSATRTRTLVELTRGCGFALLALCALARVAVAAWGGDADPKNGATWYQKSITTWQQFKQTNPAQYQLITDWAGDPTRPITPEIRAALTNVQGAIGEFRKGSQQEYCDFALDYSQGFELLLPHLGEMRNIAKAMRADAAVRLADGDTSGAANELTSLYKTSGHFNDDHILISSLVGQSMFGLADGGVQAGLDSAAFNAADAATLLAGAKQLNPDDPFQYGDALGMEQEIALATFEKYRGPEGAKAFGELLGDSKGTEAIAALDDKGYDAAVAQYDALLGQVGEIFTMTDKDAAKAAIAVIEKDIGDDKYGPLVKVIAPAFGKLLDKKFAGEQMVADRVAVLEKLASGEQKPEEAANAALWYLRAIDMWEALPKETRSTILAFDSRDISTAPSQPVVAALVEVQPILDVVREASIKRRCDFSRFVAHRGPPAIAPHYAPDMHELLDVLQADALRAMQAGDKNAAIDRFAIALRASAHLGGDANLAVCRTGQVHFNIIIDMLEAAQKAKSLDVHAPEAAVLGDAAGRVSRKDPFGYQDALKKTRDGIINRFSYSPARKTPDDLKRWGEQSQFITAWNCDQAMFMLVILDERMRRMIANPPAQAPDGSAWQADDITVPESIERMRGVFDPEAVQAVRGLCDEIGPRIANDDWEIFLGREATPVARLTDGLTRARSDLRRATRVLMLPDEFPGEDAKPTAKPG